MTIILRGLVAAVSALTLICAPMTVHLPVAGAEPAPGAAQSSGTSQIAWAALGRPDRIDLVDVNATFDTDIPVPQGVTPGQLQGSIGSVVNVLNGRVDVLDGRGVVLGTIPVPAEPNSAPFTVDISHAQVIHGLAKLSFVIREPNPPQTSCSQAPALTLNQLTVTYLGQTPFPSTVADFLPDYLEQFLIRTGPTPSPSVQQAALDLVAGLTRTYRPLPVRVDIDTSAAPAPPGPPSRRVIELRDASPAGLTVAKPNSPDAALVISGRGDELRNQIALFADRRIALAQSPAATVITVSADTPRAGTMRTFAQLGVSGRASVLGTTTLFAGFDAAAFQVGSIQQATLHLIAHNSPVTTGEASVIISSGSAVLATRRLDGSGLLDVTGVIPAESIASTVGVALEVRYLPSQQCPPINDRITFALDPASTVSVTPGTFNRGGFPSLPMAFTPDFDVVIDQPDHLRFAATAINLMAQQTTVTLQPHLTTMSAAANSGRGLLVVTPRVDLAKAGLTTSALAGNGNTVSI